MRAASASSAPLPKVMVPRQISETFRPLRPRRRYSTLVLRNAKGRLEAQHRLGPEVALPLGRAAIDRGLAVVEVARRHVVDVVTADRHDVAVIVAEPGERPPRPAAPLNGELGHLLADLGAAHLDHRGHVARSIAGLEAGIEH